jgi:hypothetical protein
MIVLSGRIYLMLALVWSVQVQGQPAPRIDGEPGLLEPQLRKAIVVPRVIQPPVVDGDLSDAVWADAALITDFTQLQPSPGRVPRQRTEVRVLFDSDYLYIGARMFDDEPERIVANQLAQGQTVIYDDHFQILLDPLDSGRRSYMFYINPNSVQRDGLAFGDSAFNMNWDGIWHARGRIDTEGWSAEVAIPFRTLSFDPARENWGLTVLRSVARTGETAAWSFRDFRLTNDSLGQIQGIRGLEQGTGLDVMPSLVLRERRDYQRGTAERRVEPSLDAFYRFTPSLIGALTLNTDFSATEVDDRQVNLTRFSLFFPEKREFFLQDADIFEFADLQQNGRPFFSRTIGLSSLGQPVDLVAGAKLTGRIGPWNLGFLGVQQDEAGDVDADLVLVGRAAVDVLEASSVGLIATYGDPRSNLESWLVGTDWNYRNVTWLTGQIVEAGAWLQRSHTQGAEGDDGAWGVRLALPNDRLEARASIVELQRNFRPAMGFVNRRDIRQYDARLYRRWREPVAWLRAWRSGAEMQQITDLDGRLETSVLRVVPVDLQLTEGEAFSAYWQRQREVLDRPFPVVDSLVIEPGVYVFERYGVLFTGAGFRRISPTLRLETGEFFGGRRQDASLRTTWTPNRHLLFDATYAVNRLQLDTGGFTTRLVSLRANVAFNVRWAWSNSVQYDNVTERLGFSTRLRYVPRLGQSLTLAVNHDQEADETDSFRSQQREISGRVSYTFRY